MGVLNTVARSLRSFRDGVVSLWDRWGGSGWGRLSYFLPGARFNYEKEAGRLWQNSVVALALKWKSDRYPIPPLRVSKIARDGKYVPLPRSDALDLWEQPNRYYDRMVLDTAVGLSLDVDGNAFIWKRRSRLGRVVELWWVPHYCVAPVYPTDGSEYLTCWRVSLNGRDEDIPPEDMIHIRVGIDPDNDRLGLSALKAQLREACAVNEESGYTASILRNTGVPGLVAMPKSDVGRIEKDQAPIIKERLRATVTGENRGEPVVMTGSVSLEVLGFTPEQLRLDRLTINAIARLGSACGVAAMSLGLPDPNKTFSNLVEADRSSWSTIKATQTRSARALRWQLLPEFGIDPLKHVVEYDYSDIQELAEDLNSLHTRVREDYKSQLITKNEARDLIGFEPDPDGDVFYGEALLDDEDAQSSADTPSDAKPADEDLDDDADDDEDGEDDDDDEKSSAARTNGKSWRY